MGYTRIFVTESDSNPDYRDWYILIAEDRELTGLIFGVAIGPGTTREQFLFHAFREAEDATKEALREHYGKHAPRDVADSLANLLKQSIEHAACAFPAEEVPNALS